MATPTYTTIASITLGSSASSVEFSSIPQDYRDLVLVFSGTVASNSFSYFRFNSDSTDHYASVFMTGNGSTTSSASPTDPYASPFETNTSGNAIILQIMDYSATDKHKTTLLRASSGLQIVRAESTRWPDTSAITSISILENGSTFTSGSTFALYGIAS